MSKNHEGRNNSPSKHTCHCLSVFARLRWEREANSVYDLSFHLSHHGTETTSSKRKSDVVKETSAKNVKECKFNIQNKSTTAHWCWQGGGVGKGQTHSVG